MKKVKIISLIAIVFLTIGITYLDFENLSFYKNYKAYILIILGICTLGFSFFKPISVNMGQKK
ncbi:hypothetical protein [Mesonia sp.]|uniref:hypothetical protein n=1 Tax=Mesonia sp. TaxID=1960830 RepID=UPI0017563B6E|nr:hypothetical protein [Mesonia sp.]HIB37533.1 hypothetical protein [Mesonia sp.]HIO27785.1 hypothetical protein [Flavobacteriaceae bacterium]